MTRLTVRGGPEAVPYRVRHDDGAVTESAMPADVMREVLRRREWEHDDLLGLYRCGAVEVGEEHVEEEPDGR